jgi:PHD/YefM family antitoxin component YafN of YafNO toxin-antitoxin module
METISITGARENLFKIVDSVIFGAPKCIKTKNGCAVMISLADWEGMQETLCLMSDKKFREEIKDRLKTPLSEYIDELNW